MMSDFSSALCYRDKPIISDLSRLEDELRKRKDEVQRERHTRAKAEKR